MNDDERERAANACVRAGQAYMTQFQAAYSQEILTRAAATLRADGERIKKLEATLRDVHNRLSGFCAGSWETSIARQITETLEGE